MLPDERSIAAVNAVEHYADEKLPDEKLVSAYSSALSAWGDTAEIAAAGDYATPLLRAADAVACFAAPNGDPAWQAARTAESLAQIEIIRCLFGNPFQPPPPLPSRLASQVQHLARTIYDERTFERLPELARELEAAGVADRTILDHCRLPGLHARGCWVLDLVLRPT